ncbi:MAG: rhomboid family intramembrane serine protease [Nitrospiria bacterium]
MIPLKADLPTWTFPFVTIGLISINIGIFIYGVSYEGSSEVFGSMFGAIPFELIHGIESGHPPIPIFASLFTSMFIHGSFFHIAGNMLYLWIFGSNIEDIMGHRRFAFFYFLCGIIAVYAHAISNAASTVPMVGASGAVSGVLGAYMLTFPRARVLTLVPILFFVQIIRIPALIVLGFWILAQFINGFISAQQGNVAWFAHIGGFFAGMVLIYFFKRKQPPWRRYS